MSQTKTDYLEKLRSGEVLTMAEQIYLIAELSVPAIFAQLSQIIMEYIDASMVGHISSNASASIGLVSSSTWLVGGLCMAANVGFNVQIAHRIGAGEEKEARNIVKMGLVSVLVYSLILSIVAVLISSKLPSLLGGNQCLRKDASLYFLIFGISVPFMQLNRAATGMLQCSGNMKLPSILHIVMCFLDVIFNMLFIFPTRTISVFGKGVSVFGFGMGVAGAALGTAVSEFVIMCILLYCVLFKSEKLKLRKTEKYKYNKTILDNAVKLAIPVGFEQVIMCGAYIMFTKIVAPLGTTAIAANSFSITAESLCYMPGYGIGSAATTLVGQSIGAGRKDMTKKLAWLLAGMGIGIMALSGALMYLAAPWMIGVLTPDKAVRRLGTKILRIEAFAEPLYGASIVANGSFRGAGDTLVPSCMNFFCMWIVRIPAAALLAGKYGLTGVWMAMAIELCVRGIIFLFRLAGNSWQKGRIKSAS